MCIFLMEKYSLSSGMLAVTIPVTRNTLWKYFRGTPYCSQSHHPPQYGLGSSHGFLCTQYLCVPVLECVVRMCSHGFACGFPYVGQLLPRHFNSMFLLL